MKQSRPPVVTVLGHVDHGKTTLLDAIRKSRVADREAGGITQSVGASSVTIKKRKITFLDTPGHAAFSKMRERGAKVADVAVLVVAADDGVMPQTREVIDYIKTAKLPLVIALTKTDLKTANVEKALSSLEKEGVLLEGRGGDTPYVKVSAPRKEGLSDLLEVILLVSDINEIAGNPEGQLEVVVIETKKEKSGPVVLGVVKNGTLRVGADLSDGVVNGRVRGLFKEDGKGAREAGLSEAVAILGFSKLPEVGVVLREGAPDTPIVSRQEDPPSFALDEEQVAVVLKAGTAGSLEALLSSLPEKAVVVKSDVGDVSDADIFFAKSAGVEVMTFEAKVSNSVKKLADTEGVPIKHFRIIYELISYLEQKIGEKANPVTGRAEVVAEFPYDRKRVAGSKIIEGEIAKSDSLVLIRGEKELGAVKISSIRKGKGEVDRVRVGEECGILFAPHLDFEVGDVLVSRKAASKR